MSYGGCILPFKKLPNDFPKWLCHFAISTTSIWDFQLIWIIASALYYQIFKVNYLDSKFEFSSITLATWCKELTHLKRPWCWGKLRAGGEGDDRGWDGWMASPTQWTWVWVNSRSWWWTGRPGVLQSMGSQRVGHDWATELNWTELNRIPGSIRISCK